MTGVRCRNVLCAVILLASMNRASAACDPEEFEVAVRGANALRDQRKDLEALAIFQSAAEKCPSPRATALIGSTLQALGRWVEAEVQLVDALSAADDPWIQPRREALVVALDVVRSHLGSLEVMSNAVGAELFINGIAAGKLPQSAPLRVVAGVSTIEVRATGRAAVIRTVSVPAGGLARETVELTEVGNGLTTRKKVGITGTVLSLAVLGAAAASNALYARFQSQWNDDDRCLHSGMTRYDNCGSDYDNAILTRDLAIAGYAIGGVGLIGSIVLMSLPAKERSGTPRAGRGIPVACAGGPGVVGLSCAGAF